MFENVKMNVSKYLHKFDAQKGERGLLSAKSRFALLKETIFG